MNTHRHQLWACEKWNRSNRVWWALQIKCATRCLYSLLKQFVFSHVARDYRANKKRTRKINGTTWMTIGAFRKYDDERAALFMLPFASRDVEHNSFAWNFIAANPHNRLMLLQCWQCATQYFNQLRLFGRPIPQRIRGRNNLFRMRRQFGISVFHLIFVDCSDQFSSCRRFASKW